MSSPEWKHFYCPHCGKRYSKENDRVFAAAAFMHSVEVQTGPFANIPGIADVVPCPACDKPIRLEWIAQGRYDSPPFDMKSCLTWVAVIAVAIVLIKLMTG